MVTLIITSTIALVVACVALIVNIRNREEIREMKRDQENFFQVVDGVIYTKPKYKGLVSRGFVTAMDIDKRLNA